MRIPIRLLIGLMALGLVLPIVVVLTWSSPTSKTSTRQVKYVKVTSSKVEGQNGVQSQVLPPDVHNLAQDAIMTIGEKSLSTKYWVQKSVHPRSLAWKKHMRETCLIMDRVGDAGQLNASMLRHILVDDNNQLLYCQIPKVASTTWRRIFLQLSGKLDPGLDAFSINANDVHHKYNKHLTYLSNMSPDAIEYRLHNYYKFMFVREPFERILSAFRNKFTAKTAAANYFKSTFGRKIIQRYRNPAQIPANNTGNGLKFEEFIAYILDDKKTLKMNEHWEMFSNLCHPCLINYDFIGKLEQIDTDSQFVMDSNNLSDRVKVPSRSGSRYTQKKTKDFMSAFYSKLPKTYLRKLYNKYRPDFMVFNYTIPFELESYL